MLPKGFGGLGDMASLMKHAVDIRNNIEEIKESLAGETIEASSGGGMVTVVFNGKMELLSLKIDPEIDTSGDPEMLETLITAAVNEGIKKSQELIKNKMQDLTGGIDIPGITS